MIGFFYAYSFSTLPYFSQKPIYKQRKYIFNVFIYPKILNSLKRLFCYNKNKFIFLFGVIKCICTFVLSIYNLSFRWWQPNIKSMESFDVVVCPNGIYSVSLSQSWIGSRYSFVVSFDDEQEAIAYCDERNNR